VRLWLERVKLLFWVCTDVYIVCSFRSIYYNVSVRRQANVVFACSSLTKDDLRVEMREKLLVACVVGSSDSV